jgi:tetratricopeptide (TPR) repeat protein
MKLSIFIAFIVITTSLAYRWHYLGVSGLFVIGLWLFCAAILPITWKTAQWIAEWFITALLSSHAKVQPNEATIARSLFLDGNYEGAVATYLDVAKKRPQLPFPLLKAAQICRENLDNPLRAAAILESAMNRSNSTWETEGRVRLYFQLAELYEDPLQNPVKAREVLERVCSDFPRTIHAVQARKILRLPH